MPSLETKELNVLIDTRRFFDTPIKNIKETYEKIIETGRKDFITSNLLDYEYFPKHYKLIAIDWVSKFNQKILI